MFELSLENKLGEKITLTHREAEYQVIDVEGLDPPNATITSSNVVGMDGSKYQNARLEERNIVITVKINGNIAVNRNRLYKYAKSKQYCKVYYKSSTHDVFAEGYVETNECSSFTNDQRMQISIVCHDPYLQSVYEIYSDISKVLGLFTFPFAFGAAGVEADTITDEAIAFGEYDENRIVNIINEGAETGLVISFTVSGSDVINPIFYDVLARESFGLNMTLHDGDAVEINTNRGQKSVTLTRHAVRTNIINNIVANSTWLQLREGDNVYTYTADEGAEHIFVHFKHRTRYEGV